MYPNIMSYVLICVSRATESLSTLLIRTPKYVYWLRQFGIIHRS
jgi:hypothetical protein